MVMYKRNDMMVTWLEINVFGLVLIGIGTVMRTAGGISETIGVILGVAGVLGIYINFVGGLMYYQLQGGKNYEQSGSDQGSRP